MSGRTLLTSLLRCKAWADKGLVDTLAARGRELPATDRENALAILAHAHVVDRIFLAHLLGEGHGFASTTPAEPPRPETLFPAIEEVDRLLLERAEQLGASELAEEIAFEFTDGRAGRMSREEMLGHLVGHGGYHRGEVGQILTRHFGSSPPDTFTGYLHRTEPKRRERVPPIAGDAAAPGASAS